MEIEGLGLKASLDPTLFPLHANIRHYLEGRVLSCHGARDMRLLWLTSS